MRLVEKSWQEVAGKWRWMLAVRTRWGCLNGQASEAFN